MNICRTHTLFDHEVFKTELFLNYKEYLGTFISTSVNPVSQSLKAALPELSSQLYNLHSDVNGHHKTSMDYLSSNSFQINDNDLTVKNDVRIRKSKTLFYTKNNLSVVVIFSFSKF